MSALIPTSAITKTATLLNTTLRGAGSAQPKATPEKSSTARGDKETRAADNQQDKLLKAVNAYREVLDLVSKLLGTKENDQSFLYGAGNNDRTAQLLQTVDRIKTGEGDDIITAFGFARVNSGGGNDVITTHSFAQVNSGAGNDVITAYGGGQVNAGKGNDNITAFGGQINAGEGDDTITTYGGRVEAGDGTDVITSIGGGYVNAGDGDDVINAGIFSQVEAGDGDDIISAGPLSRISAGAGDDTIRATGTGITIDFNKGDGHDEIYASSDIAINIGEGLSADDVNISTKGGQTIITFNGSDESLTLNLSNGAKAQLTFAAGNALEVGV